MEKEVTKVPKGKFPLDVLAELGIRTRNAWIYLHENVVGELDKSFHHQKLLPNGQIQLTWNETNERPFITIKIKFGESGPWKPVIFIGSEVIAFTERSLDPYEIFFLKMEE